MCAKKSQIARVGLEVHARLKTGRKLFCPCPVNNDSPPNSHLCEYCSAQPGALPVTDVKAVRLAIAAAVMFGSNISDILRFDRKSYFYPDSPKGYQITQHFNPLARGGSLELRDGGLVRLRQIHIEEDSARLVHEGDKTLVDLNRCGAPLIEIVTEPDLSNGTETGEFLALLRRSLQFAGISDCDTQSGGFRVDINVSVCRGERVELKNVGSFRAARNAVDAEAERQRRILEAGDEVTRETRHCLDESGKSASSRGKEQMHNYRYMPEPDLRPVRIGEDLLAQAREVVCELPLDRERRFVSEYGLSQEVATTLCSNVKAANLLDEAVKNGAPARECGNWIATVSLSESEPMAVHAQELAKLCFAIAHGKLTRKAVRELVWPHMASGEHGFVEAVEKSGVSECRTCDLQDICKRAVCAMPEAVESVRTGKTKAVGALIGEVMRLSKGTADAAEAKKLILRMIHGGHNG